MCICKSYNFLLFLFLKSLFVYSKQTKSNFNHNVVLLFDWSVRFSKISPLFPTMLHACLVLATVSSFLGFQVLLLSLKPINRCFFII